jgi:hypothetical protein
MAFDIKSGFKTPSFVLGIIFAILGFKTLSKPIYYFRGSYVDFTGYNIPVGYSLIILALIFILFSYYKTKR